MKSPHLYLFLAFLITLSLAVTSACGKAAEPAKAPAAPAAPSAPSSVAVSAPVPATGSPDLVITKVWLDGKLIYYTVKNVGTAASPPTYANIYVEDLLPTMGSSSFIDVLKPGEERTSVFTNYQWPYDSNAVADPRVEVSPKGYIDLLLNNTKVKVCADANNEAKEAVENNNCKVALIGILWGYDMLPAFNLAIWSNGEGKLPAMGSEGSPDGAHFKVSDGSYDAMTQMETIPQQVPQGWIQGVWGHFYSDPDWGKPESAAIKIPAKLHFTTRIGLSRNATGSDGVTYKFGIKDLNDTVTWLASKKITVPGAFENWDVNLSDYEGQKYYFVLRVEAGNSPINDFAIWDAPKLMQIND